MIICLSLLISISICECDRLADLWKAICYLNDTKLLEFVLTVGSTDCLLVVMHTVTYILHSVQHHYTSF